MAESDGELDIMLMPVVSVKDIIAAVVRCSSPTTGDKFNFLLYLTLK